MDQSAFYGVMSAVNFTLLGLWWVAVKDRTGLGEGYALSYRTAYLVSLQFLIPGTVSLLAQVAPDEPVVWRIAFGLAGVVGAVGIVMLAGELAKRSGMRFAPTVFLVMGVPLYVLVSVVSLLPAPTSPDVALTPIQIEALLLSLIVFMGAQEAWVVSMAPPRAADSEP